VRCSRSVPGAAPNPADLREHSWEHGVSLQGKAGMIARKRAEQALLRREDLRYSFGKRAKCQALSWGIGGAAVGRHLSLRVVPPWSGHSLKAI
jgi:hypothetical protein